MKTTLLLAVFIAIVGRFMADEVKAWSSWLHKELRRRAVAKLPAKCRDRYDEEWESGIEEVPGEIFKILYSIDLLSAAFGIRKIALNGSAGASNASDLLKRTFDIVISSFLLIFCLPVILAITVGVNLGSRGPVIYKRRRIGKSGREFFCLRFRTMTSDSACEAKLTQLGLFLRRTSLDELPQLFNVLKGEMSIVGPPPQTVLNDQLSLEVAPGLTGLWQLSGDPSYVSLETLTAEYVENRSLWLDLKILLRTILFTLQFYIPRR